MPGASWMTREQSIWLKTKMDGFRLSQLKNEVSSYLTDINREWFEKWPEIALHFKDSATGVPLPVEQLTQDEMDKLGDHVKRRQAVRYTLTLLSQIAELIYSNCGLIFTEQPLLPAGSEIRSSGKPSPS
jgi:hypothetical protein